jgi:hypothetical protein
MPIDTQNIRIVIMPKQDEAIVLLKRELYMSDILDDVVTELANLDFSGSVVFDMLLTKGISEHYYNMRFANKAFDYGTNVLMSNPAMEIVMESKMYYRSHPEYLERTSLTPRQINRVRVWMEEW